MLWAGVALFSLRPAVRDLVFQLYSRPLHPELFEILAVRTVRREDYELTVSHHADRPRRFVAEQRAPPERSHGGLRPAVAATPAFA